MNPSSRTLQWTVWGGLAATVAVILGLFVLERFQRHRLALPVHPQGQPDSGPSTNDSLPVLFSIPDFSLTNQENERVELSTLRGQLWIADIIFTRCAGPCPEMTRRMAEFQGLIQAEAPVKLVTLTTDPEYDSPAVLQAYARRFGAQSGRWHFLTGPKKAMAELAVGGLKLTALEKEPVRQENPNDLFIHSTLFVLVDGAGRARAVFENEDPAVTGKVTQAVQRLLKERDR